ANLPRVAARADHEKVGEAGRLAQIEHDELDRLLVFGGADRALDLLRQRLRFSSSITLGHATCLPRGVRGAPPAAGRAASAYKARAAQCVAARQAAPCRRSIAPPRARAGWQNSTRPPSAPR